MGVLTLAAGSKTADEQELKQIAFDESLVFMLKDFRALIRNPRLIVSPLSTLSGTVVIEGPTEPVVEITTVQTQRVVRDIVFMVDGSSYIGGANFPYVRDFIAGVVNQLDVRPDRVRIGLMQFAENPKIEFYLNTHNTKQDVLASLGELRLMGGSALNTGAAMDYALTNMFQASTGSRKRQGVQQVLLLITGGPSQDEVKRIADKVAVAGVLTFTVSAGQADEDYLKTVAFVPNLAYHESRFADLPSVVEQIMTPLTTVVGDTDITETEITEEPAVVGGERDVAFLIDGSDNVRADFPYIRDFIIKVIEPLDIGQDRVRISVVQHSERPAPNFYLNTYKDKAEVLRAVNDLRLSGGRSLNTGMALKFMKDTILSPVHGSRAAQNVPQFLIVLTGGKSKDSVKESAGALKTDGVVPFGVGVKDADPKQIEAISHNPSFAFNVKEFSQLSTVQQKLNSYVSLSKENLKVVLEEASVHADAVKRDIVFLLDSSDGTRSGFPALRDFVQSVVDKLSVEENRERVSLVQYSDKPEAHFYLNSHKTKDAVIHAISNMRHKGGRSLNTGAALQFVRHNIFTASSGSRRLEGVPQVLILLTSKKSRDDVTGPAVALKDLEIVSIGVGVGDANFRELETISFQPGFTFQVSELSELPSIHPQFVALLKRLSKDTEEAVAPVTHGIPDLVVDTVSSKRDIVFLLDGSDDSRNGLPAIREFIRRMANELDIDGDNVRVAVVQYSDDAAEYFHLKAHKTKRAVIYAVRSLRHKGGRLRNTGAALQYVRDNVFTASSGSRHLEGVPQILFLLIGGESSDDVTAAASDLKRLGVLSFAIGMKNVRQEELQSIAYSSRFIFNLPVFGELLSIQPEILAFVQSKMGIEPPTIVVELDAAQRDIVFLLDGSDDSRSGFPAMCGFVQRLVENLNVGENKDRVSVVQYSRNPEAHFLLNTYPEKQSVLGSIRSLQHKGGRPLNTGAALQYVKDNVFTASSGSRSQEGIPQILILLSGGKSQDDVGGAAAALKQDRIVPFSIGTRNSDILELQMIAHIPSYALSVPRFDDLESIQQQLLSFVKRVPRQPRVYQPTVVDNTESKQLDVVFLLDGSDETLNGFEAIRDFVQRVVEKLTVQETRDRVSVVQYSKEPEAHFYLNTYTTKQDIVDAVRQLRHKGGITLNTGAALQYVRDNIFTASSGSRRQEGIPQILVLLSGGRSNDDVRNAVKNLKAIDVMAIVVGMRNADTLELQTISDEPSYAFYAPNYNDLPNIQQQVFSAVQKVAMTTPNLPTTLIDATTDDRRDIVFLLDGSDDSRRIFPDIQDFMQRVVEKLNVDGNKDHVSVVQYSDTAEVNFNLGMHSTKDYVIDAVRGLRHKGGSPLNTGAALQYVRDNVFTASSGSRSLQGVPQILILLSGGRSTDDIRTPVTKLKEMGVISIGIGTGDADTLELQTISHEPNYALSITDFEDPTIQKELLSLLTEASHQPEPGAPTMHFESDKKDVVFLIDGSDNSKTGFEGIRRFAEKVVEILNVEENGDRVALVQYSGNATPNFYLNSYSSKNDVLNSIRSMRHTVGRPLNTGTALKFVRDTVFTASAGGRRAEGVPQYLFVFSGGRSSDDIMGPAQSLRGDGVRTFSIGTRNADTLELQMISFKPGDSFSVSNFNNLDSIHSSVTAVINGVQETPEMSTVIDNSTLVTSDIQRVDGVDVVFLLDGSDEMQKGVQSICDFLGQFVEHLDIGPDKAQVAMIQYSNKPTTHFLLNTYSSKIDIMAEVRNINLEGGRSRNTGEALDYVKNNVFNTSSGSRRQEGIPQILILISGGKSQDDVLVPSESLKAEGIVLLTVAVKYANGAEMQSIAYSPNHAYLLREFSDLSLVRQQLLSAVVSHKDTVRPGLVQGSSVKRDIVFLLDGSDDVRSRFTDIREFVAKVVEKFDVDKGKDQVAVLQYSNSAAVNFNLNAYKTRDDVLSAVRNLRPKGGRPLYTGTALQFVKDNVFTNNAASRRHEGAEQILVLLTGGRSRDSPRGPSRALKTLGVVTFAIGSRMTDLEEMQSISSLPNYSYSVHDFANLQNIQQSLETNLAQVRPQEVTRVVESDGSRRDIVFLLDGSDNTRTGFPAIQEFLHKIIENLNVEQKNDRVAVVQFSDGAVANFYLNSFLRKNDMLNSVRALSHKGGRPLNTGAALKFVKENVFTRSSGSRQLDGVKQMLILLSSGRSRDNVDAPASALKELGVLVFVIGTRSSDSRELQKISYDPSYALSVSEFTDLPNIQQQLLSAMNTAIIQETTMTPTVPTILVKSRALKRDVVFLLDGSDGTRRVFPAMRDFVQRLVETLSVDENKDRVAVVQYSRDPAAQFYLNTYTTKGEILNTVRGLRHKGGRPLNTGAALQYVRDNVFTASSGSRRLEGVPQLLILLSGGRSVDNVDTPASALKELGVLVFGIGTRSSDSRELQRISHDPSYALSVSDFTDLPSIQQQLLSSVEAVVIDVTPESPTVLVDHDTARKDVVFLLDGSDGTRNGFPAIRDFVQRVVEKLNVGGDKDRVSVVQYGRDQEVHFYLNTYTTQGDILDIVRGLRHRGGRPLNTGAALQYVRDNVFTASSGSRSQEGVPQMLILLSGGRSNDNVDIPVSALKESGVLIFGIGNRNSSKEVQRIASDPSYSQSVSEFSDLPSVQDKFFSSLITVHVGATPISPTVIVDLSIARKDVVFLLDGSDGTRNGFTEMRDFVQRVVEKLTVGENRDRVSVVQYSREPEVHFYLNTYTRKEEVVDTVRGLKHKGGRPLNTGAALQYVRDYVFAASSGSRRLESVPQILILLNGGRSFDNVDKPASALKELGVLVFGIGTRSSDSRELQKISYDPSYALSVSEFTDLPNIQQQLLSAMNTAIIQDTTMTPTLIPTILVESQAPRRDVVFLLDGSDGTRSGFPAMRDFVQRVVETLSVDENKDRVAVVQYSRDPAAQFYLNTYTTKGDILNTVRGLRHKGGRPLNTGAALQYVRDNVFTASSGSRRLEGVPQLLILLSGGRSVDNVDTPASALKELGVLVFGIGTRSSDSRELQRISHDPSYALSVSDFTDLPSIQQQLLSSVEAVVIDVTPESPTVLVDHDTARKDVVFLLDGSDGTRNGFPAIRDFVQRVVEKLNVGGDKDRVSVVQYGRDQEVHFYLNTYTTQGDILDTVRGLRHRGGRPLNTGAALQYVRDNVFTASSGSRSQEGVPQMLILLSGGRSNDNVDIPVSALKESGVLIFGIGNRNSSKEVQRIASDPSYSQSVSEFSDLPSVQDKFFSSLITVHVGATPISPTVIVDLSIARKDVVFLLDGSDGTRNGFTEMRDFVQRVVEKLTVGENRDRVSVVQYSREPEVHFYLNTYTRKEEVVDTVRGLKHKGGRPLNTGAALQYVRDYVFAASSGSRRLESVPQILILLNGGRSFDNVDKPASALKELGVLVFGIGTRSSDSRELQKISYDPSYALSVSEFTDLPNIQQQLLSAMNTAIIQDTTMTPTLIPTILVESQAPRRDVVFLLDGSDGTRSGFPAMRDFVQRVVETLSVDENKDRVAVVQYSRDPAAQFYLNTYTTKGDILNTVRGLRHKGGRPLNTGAALQYVRDNVFTASSGSRRLEGVPQLLILLSGGRSVDNVDTPASALKELGVLVFGIGTRSSDSRELQRISHDPSYALSVSDFTDLPSIQQQLLSSVEAVVIDVTPESPTVLVDHDTARKDVVFLLDGSDGTRNGFPAMRDFVQRVVEKLNVGGDKDRVSVVQYGRDQEVNFYLNTYTMKGDILDIVRGLRHRGGRPLNTGAALQYVRDNVFTASSGSRSQEGVPQMLILLSGGRSNDNVDIPVSALKESGVLIFGIGNRNSSKEVQRIASDPSYSQSVSEFSDLPSVQDKFFSSLITVHVGATPISPTVIVDLSITRKDVVFLLDGSDGTRNGFTEMRDFVQRVVEKLTVGENRDRVSVVQYSREPEVHFYLNTYTRKEEVVDTVRGLKHKGGRPLNTGAALQYVRDYVFAASSGSRRLESVPQILILLNGGRSFDNVDKSASALKELGVLVFGIGTRSSDSGELQKISYDPSYALSVSEFTDLPNIQQQLLSALNTAVIQDTTMTPTLIPTILVESQAPRRDVVFLLDGSDGTRSGFPAMRDFVQRVVETLSVDENKDRVAVVQYSRDPAAQFYLNTYTTKGEILNTVRGLRHKGGRPLNTGAALQYVRDNVFTASSGSRRLEGVPQLLILLSGGRSVDNVDTPASALKELGVLVFGIGTRSSDSRELQRISHDPSYALSVSDFTDLPSIQQQLLSSVEAVVIDVTPESPTVLVDHDTARKDVVFLLDGSDGTRNGFPAMRDFVQRVVEKLNVGGDKDRVSVVQYGRDQEVHFYLNTYTTKGDILDIVRGLRHRGGRPLNTGAALQYVRDNVFTASSGSRSQEGVPQMLILLSGGRSNDNVDIPVSALKESGVLIFGIGNRNSSKEVQRIASDPSYSQSVSEFSDLPSVQDKFFSSLITVHVGATPISPTVIVDLSITRKDVVFLLDGSDGTRNGFTEMRDFVQRVVEKLTVGENRDRVSVVQYSREPEVHFYLNTYTRKEEVVDTVRGLKHKGGRPLNTGAALQYVRDYVFAASSGSRRLESVPQILILLNGGRSFDNVDKPASALKELGVLVFGIGTRSSDSGELQKISYDPSYALSVSEFTDLPNIQQQLLSALNTAVIQDTTMTPTLIPTILVESQAPRRDVVFLLDGSDGTRSGFPAMRDFVQRVVETLSVDENKDRVAVVQYSRDPAAQFYLNTYTTKGEILNTVRGLRHKGGRPLNTGAALQYVRDNVFTASSGSRRLEGVPQLLILLSGGRSVDNVDTPASALKELGVLVFGIGTRSSDSRELQRISHDPSYALSVSDFTDLPSIQQQLLSSVEAVVIDVTPESPTVLVDHDTARKDVVFLLDGSDGTRNGFPAIRDFVQRVVEKLNVGGDKDRVSVVQYGRDQEVHFYLNTYTTKGDILDIVRGLRHRGGRPLNTGAALQYVRDNVFTASSGSRSQEGVPQMLILLSGGRSNDNVDIPVSALKESGVLIFGIGNRNSSKEVQRIASDPSYSQSVSEFSDLPSVQDKFFSSLITVHVGATPISPTVIVDLSITRKDVVFLLDGSDGTRNGFTEMRDFVQRVVEKLTVGENRDRVSVVQYSREPEVHFYLNTYTRKEEVVDTVRGLKHKGGRPLNTGAALQYVRDYVFAASSGSRRLESVPQILILLNGGRSFDNVDKPASALKELGVLVFGIGTRSSDSGELQKISYDPSYALSVSEFTDLPNIQQQLLSALNTAVIQDTTMTPTLIPTILVESQAPRRDVVFLLDGSDGTRSGFPAMRDFVQRVVETLSVDENKDRVAVVQYSRDPAAQFYLNTYTTKGEILNTVRGLRHKGGRPLNTGAALQYVRDNVFTASSGSRRLEGVPQLLILLSGGRSVDNVDTPASALKELGVLVFGIGTRSSDSRELQRISHDPSYALSVSDFTDLPSIQQQLLSSVEAVVIDVTPESPTVLVDHDTARKDVVFLLDGSDGTRNGFPAIRDFVQRVVEKLNVGGDKDRVSVVQYGRDQEVLFYLNTYTTKGDILDIVRGMRHRGGRPLNTGAALQYVRDNVFTASSGSRSQEGVPQMLILLSGGRSNDNVDIPVSALKESGVLIFGIGNRNSSKEVQRIASDPSYSQSVSEFSDLPSVQDKFFSSLITVHVGATPISPTVIVDLSITRKDVVFLLDGSDGTRNGFTEMRDFVQRVVEKLTVGENRDRVSVVQYSREPEVHFYLNTYTRKEEVVDTVRGLKHKGGRPLNTGAALQYVRDYVFAASSGSRRLESVPQILILLNGGRSFDNVDKPTSALKELGVLVFGIGTRSSDSRELQKISYDPSYALSVSEFTDLPNIQQQLLSAMNTAVIQDTTMTPTLMPTIIVKSQAPRRDVVFLLDGSDGTRSGFPAMRDFVQRVVETLSVDENKDRVAVVQYSRDPAAQFYLNTYTTKGEILNTVRGLRHKGGRPLNTGAALQYVRDNVFTASSGSRRLEGVPQLLILLSGGRSVDNVDTPASALKELGVLVFGIGTRSSDSRELQRISHDPSYALSVSDFTDLPSIQQQLLSSVEAVVIDVTPESPTVLVDHDTARKDVVFLLDGSDGTRNGFPAMRDFVQRVVEKLNVGGDKDRVSVVQYGRDQEVHFYLNTYTTKGDILDIVRGLRHRGGRPLNTGAALQYVRDNVFTASSGSRSQEGVPQMLILLSGGRSNDNVHTPASALKKIGVMIFSVGSRASDINELQRISFDPSYALSVSEFSDLPNIQEHLLTRVETFNVSLMGETMMGHRDVVFLLDGSDGTRNGFPAMRDFVLKVVENLNVGGNKDRISVVQYSRNQEVHFYLNTYTKKEDILDSIRHLRHKGGRPLNTGAALQFVKDHIFKDTSGSRRYEGVPQILILLSGGQSNDAVSQAAFDMKGQGIQSVGIAIRQADTREMQSITSDPQLILVARDFSDLSAMHLELSSSIAQVSSPGLIAESQGPKKDIVFLVDGSDGVGREFPIIQEFISSIVKNLNVGENKIRIGVVQYGDSPNADIYLNSHTTKEGVMNAVKGLRQRGGRERNLGQAVEFVSSEVLNVRRGGRKEEGVPQFLIVVSGGRSTDDIRRPATSLKKSGVLPFSIGTRDVNSQELQVVSYVPNFAYTVDDLPGLYTVQDKLISTLTEMSDDDIARLRPVFPTPDGNALSCCH
uniref:VWFA domain-containing protein n=1 Tax=Oncorhynchus mykiss TaxID=8022 RepID=A0A8C7W8S6_ONCMY